MPALIDQNVGSGTISRLGVLLRLGEENLTIEERSELATMLAVLAGGGAPSHDLDDLGAALERVRRAHDGAMRQGRTSSNSELIAALQSGPKFDRTEYGGPGLRKFLGNDEPTDEDGLEEWLVKGIVAAATPGMIGGPPKSGKTFIAEHIGLSIAAGLPWLGRHATRRGRVLILPREDTRRETRRRIWRLARGLGLDPRDLAETLRIDVDVPFHWDNPADVARLEHTITSWRPDLVILDSLIRTHHADENSAQEMSLVTARWADLCTTHGVAIVIVHHVRKPPAAGDAQAAGMRLRGSGDLFAVLRHFVSVEPQAKGTSRLTMDGNLSHHQDSFTVTLSDGTDSHGKPCIRIEYRDSELLVREQELELETRILGVVAERGVIGSRDLRDAVGGRSADVDRRVHTMVRNGQLERQVNRLLRIPLGPSGVAVDQTSGVGQSVSGVRDTSHSGTCG